MASEASEASEARRTRVDYADVSCFLVENRKHLQNGQIWLALPLAPPDPELCDVEIWFAADRASVVVRGAVLAVAPEADEHGRWLTGIELGTGEKNRLVRRIQKMLEGSIQPDSRRQPIVHTAPPDPPPRSKRARAAPSPASPSPDEPSPAAATAIASKAHVVVDEKLTTTTFAMLSVAEQTRLALRGDRGERQMVLRKKSIPLIRYLLENPGLTENEVVELAGMREMTHEILERIADDHEWRASDPVRVALLQNVSTPIPLAVRMVPLINRRELRRMYKRRKLRAPIELAIRRLLEPSGTPS